MTNNLQPVGVRAVIENLRGYLTGFKQMEQANLSLARAQLAVQSSSLRTANVVRTSQQSLASAINAANNSARISTNAYITAQKNREKVERLLAQARVEAEEKVRLAQSRVARSGTFSPERQAAAQQALARSQRQLDNLRINGAENVAAAIRAEEAALASLEARAISSAANIRRARGAGVAGAAGALIGEQRAAIGLQAANLKATGSTKLLSGAQTILAGTARTANSAVQALGTALIAMTGFGNRAAVALRFGAAAITAFGTAAAIGQATKFEDSLVKIRNLTAATDADTLKLKDSILAMSQELPKSPDELGAAVYFIMSRGIRDVDEALTILRSSAKAAVGSFITTEQVAKVVTAVLLGYGKENISAAQATDILIASIKEGGAEASEYGDELGRLFGTARNLGVGFNQLGAIMAFLTNTGLSASQSTTALLGILNQLFSPSAEAEKTLTMLGTSIQELRLQIREKGLVAALQEMFTKFGANQEVIAQLFPEVRGLNGALLLLSGNSQQYNIIQANVNKSLGITDANFERTRKTFSSYYNILKNQLNVALINLGTAILPSLIVVIQRVSKFIKDNGNEIKNFAAGVVKAGIALASGIGKGIGVIAEILSIIPSNARGVIAAVTAIGVAMALAWGPKSKAFLGIAGILTLLGSLKSAGTGKGGLGSVVDILSGFAGGAIGLGFGGPGGALLGAGIGAGILAPILKDILGITEEQATEISSEFERVFGDVTKSINDSFGQIDLGTIGQEFKDFPIDAIKKDAEALEQLKEAFRSSSEEAGKVKSLTDSMNLFGEVSFELAQKLKLSATAAGNLQAFDAVFRAEERAGREAFELAKAVGTLAGAFQRSADVANKILLAMGRSALAASQAAAAQVFSRPTREVADLNVQLANSKVTQAKTSASNDPKIAALQRQLADLDRQIAAASRQTSNAAPPAAVAVNKAGPTQAANQANNIANAQLTQLKLANISLQQLIYETQQAASTLQEKFLQSNEDLQRQINAAIGRGDTAGALSLVARQKEEAKAFQAEFKGLQKKEQDLTTQQRQNEIAQQLLSIQQESVQVIEQQVTSIEAATTATDSQTSSTNSVVDSLNVQKDGIQQQIDKLQEQTDATDSSSEAIQKQIDIYQAETDALKALVEASDATLLTQEEQKAAALKYAADIGFASSAVRAHAQSVFDLLPDQGIVEEARRQNELFRTVMQHINEGTLPQFVEQMDFAKLHASLFGSATERATKPLVDYFDIAQDIVPKVASTLTQAANDIDASGYKASNSITNAGNNASGSISTSGIKAASSITTAVSGITGALNLAKSALSGIKNLVTKNAAGGIYSSPTLTWVGETHQKEAIIPLERPARAREILSSISPSLLASVLPNRGGDQMVFAPNIVVTGETLDTMESVVHSAVNRAFRDAASRSARSGGLLTQSIGPTR